MATDTKVARLDDARVRDLRRQQLPRCDWRDLLTVKGEPLSADDAQALDGYFRRFLQPRDGACVNCGERQGGSDIVAAMFGRFEWGIAHGEGHCGVCGYPARAYHYDIGPIKRLECILQIHPDELLLKSERAETEGAQ